MTTWFHGGVCSGPAGGPGGRETEPVWSGPGTRPHRCLTSCPGLVPAGFQGGVLIRQPQVPDHRQHPTLLEVPWELGGLDNFPRPGNPYLGRGGGSYRMV